MTASLDIEKKFMSPNDSYFSMNYQLNNIDFFEDFTDKSCEMLIKRMSIASKENADDIKVYINSRGGSVIDLLAVLDTMSLIRNDISTIGIGQCASCGAVLLSSGKKGKRFITENARVLIHQVSSGMWGTNSDIQISAKETERLNKLLVKILAKNCGKKPSEIEELIAKGDKIFTAKEALEFGLVDKIVSTAETMPDETIDTDKMETKSGDMNTSQLKFEVKAFKEDDNFFYLKGIASTPDKDLVADKVNPKSLMNSVKEMGLPKFVHQHSLDQMPLGIPLEVNQEVVDGQTLTIMDLQMPKSVQKCRDVFELAKMGAYGGLSIGYIATDYEFEENVRVINELKWLEVSLVTIPANPKSKLLEVKTVTPFQNLPLADRDMAWDSAKAIKNVRKKTNSEEAPSTDYKKAFFWYDGEEAEKFGSYKLPYVDVVDGQLKVVPRAIFAVAGVLQGARGGVDIPEAEQTAIKKQINKYYAKMRKEFDDETITSPFEKEGKSMQLSEVKDIRSAEKFLLANGVSKSDAVGLISIIKNAEVKREDNLGEGKGEPTLNDESLNSILEVITETTKGLSK